MGYGSVESQGYVSIYGDTMKGPIDMGGNGISGLPEATEDTQPVRLAEFNSFKNESINNFTIGNYIGNDNIGTTIRTINIGFTPKAVFLATNQGIMFNFNSTRVNGGIITTNNDLIYRGSSGDVVIASIVANGFTVRSEANTRGATYVYVAFA